MKKYFITADVHSFYKELRKALKDAGFKVRDPNHIWINCGDLLDRGPDSVECLKFACKLLDQDRFIGIKGNHELLFNDISSKGCFERHDTHNGTQKTYMHLFNDLYLNNNEHIAESTVIETAHKHPLWTKYYNSLKNYYELGDYIFVHAWIPYDEWGAHSEYDSNWRLGNWRNAVWTNPFDAWQSGIKEPGKTIVCGHWSTSYAHSRIHNYMCENIKDALYYFTQNDLNIFKEDNGLLTARTRKILNKYICNHIFRDEGIIGLDATTVLSGRVNCLVLEI